MSRLFICFLWGGGNPQDELLDRPLSNFDVIGIPTGTWSSNFFACHQNLVPSCVLSFFLPCIMWAQVVVRAQIPLLIGLKNSLQFLRRQSGYGCFVDYFFWSLAISLGLLIVLIVVNKQMPYVVAILLALVLIALLGTLIYLLGHTRTAFREKYELPGTLPCRGVAFWDWLADLFIMVSCLPCALSQMARHVFQYDLMDSELGLYVSDPSALPPLPPTPDQQQPGSTGSSAFERPRLADEAGLNSFMGGSGADIPQNTGAAHRQQAIEQRQREEIMRDGATPATATLVPSTGSEGRQQQQPAMAEARIIR